MTTNTISASVLADQKLTECGRAGCVVLYTGDNCAFCDGAREIIINALADFGVGYDVVTEVNISSGVVCACDFPGMVTLPTIRVCDQLISGLPQIDDIRAYLMYAILKGCFPF
ncbi:MAG: hypothetical protein P1Q69_11080 [Candidatus Thorarchaeota archaeon]|nr:hypothetical protein [Candidatus Thorarchaeota archaeon]